jgi:hypothetical protein
MFRIVHQQQDWNAWPCRELADLSQAQQYLLLVAQDIAPETNTRITKP